MTLKKDDPKKICEYCNLEFFRVRYPSKWEDRKKFAGRKYCSRLCMIEASLQREKTRQWIGIKIQVFKKDKCSNCNGTRRLSIHHRDGNWKNNDVNNLLTLCSSCHTKLHWKRGDFDSQKTRLNNPQTCKVCNLLLRSKGFCNKHYRNWLNTGHPYGKKRRDELY